MLGRQLWCLGAVPRRVWLASPFQYAMGLLCLLWLRFTLTVGFVEFLVGNRGLYVLGLPVVVLGAAPKRVWLSQPFTFQRAGV